MGVSNKHLFHILVPSYWPLFIASGAFLFVTGIGYSVHFSIGGFNYIILGLFIILITSINWFIDVIKEAFNLGDHTRIVRAGLKAGFLLFIASEVMLFLGFFWAFFHSSLCPAVDVGTLWPPVGLLNIKAFDYPLLNTIILIISGLSVTWAHRGLALGNYKTAADGFFLTILLGLFFIMLQGLEYFESTFNLRDGVYSSVFFMLTGLHGFHVIVGVVFLSYSLYALLHNHYLSTHYARFVFAAWYWHFVDIVWILLFLTLYCWGSW